MKAQKKETDFKLSSKEDWAEEWSGGNPMLTFDPTLPFFRDIHKLCQHHLPVSSGMRCLEIGCYPGTYMWYFNTYFKHKVSGIEYVDECVPRCKENMASLGIDAEIIHADLFDYKPPAELWDVVASFGFIEHFTDTQDVIQRHLDLLKPGGYLVLVIPNHAGLNGKILKAVDKDKHAIHNLMPYDQMANAVEKTCQAEIIEGGYYGHLGFWNTDLYPKIDKMSTIPYYASKVPLYILERIAPYVVPNTQFFAPNSALIAKKL
ncbi:MAG: class I SAM-dependent methyltransferase [Rhodospirillales bacterium]|nr:class I SAM-dependent methyltransferase [Rhodospirillales bacterium]